jgi:hypothetical protein
VKARLHQLSDRVEQRLTSIHAFEYTLNEGSYFGGVQFARTSFFSGWQRSWQSSLHDDRQKTVSNQASLGDAQLLDFILAAVSRHDLAGVLPKELLG